MVAVRPSEKIVFKEKHLIRDKESYDMIRGTSVPLEDIKILNLYLKDSKYIKQKKILTTGRN
jgi:hypothetical protein